MVLAAGPFSLVSKVLAGVILALGLYLSVVLWQKSEVEDDLRLAQQTVATRDSEVARLTAALEDQGEEIERFRAQVSELGKIAAREAREAAEDRAVYERRLRAAEDELDAIRNASPSCQALLDTPLAQCPELGDWLRRGP